MIPDPEKIALIAEIERMDKFSKLIDLDKYSVQELKFHLKQLRRKK